MDQFHVELLFTKAQLLLGSLLQIHQQTLFIKVDLLLHLCQVFRDIWILLARLPFFLEDVA